MLSLIAALANEPASTVVGRVFELLSPHGVSRHEGGEPWFEVVVGDRRLAIGAPVDRRTPELEALVRAALVAALTREVEAEERDRLSERLEMLSAASFEGILVHVDGVVIDANHRLTEMLGWDENEILGDQTLRRCVAPEDLPSVLQRMRDRVEGDYTITGVRKDGSRFRAELLSKQGRLGARPVRIVAVRDVTAREKTHALLRESEDRLRELAASVFDMFVTSTDGVIIQVGGRVEALLGSKPEDLVGRKIVELVAPAARELTDRVIQENRVGSYESALVDVRGEVVPVEVFGVVATLDGEPVRVAGIRDLRPKRQLEAERSRLDQQLQRSQRLESLGVLAGGIAHDFNNLLVAIMGNAELLSLSLVDPEDRECAMTIRKAGERAAELTRQMLAYAGRGHARTEEPVDLAVLLSELHQMLGATLSKKAEVELSLAPRSLVMGDRSTLAQVFMNLLTNASDALAEKPGKITIRTRHTDQLDARWDDALGATIDPGKWLLIEVSDTGVGMDEATRLRVFEPFFSTKPRGHGLGLAACLGIVRAHKGAIVVESERGRGSRFSIVLPALDHADVRTARAADVATVPCRVLVIDDERIVREHVRRVLSLRGYSVSEAEGGAAGLARLEARDVDVVLLDLTMADMDGLEVIRELRARNDSVPIILSSGYLDAESEHELQQHAIQGFLRKPYRLEDLVSVIERARGTKIS